MASEIVIYFFFLKIRSGSGSTDTCNLSGVGPFAYVMVAGYNNYQGATLTVTNIHNMYTPSGGGVDGARCKYFVSNQSHLYLKSFKKCMY